LYDGHEAFAQPLLRDPGFPEFCKTENILTDEMAGIKNISADSGVRETAGVTKHFALSRDEKQKPDGAEYPCMETEYIPYLHFIRFHDY